MVVATGIRRRLTALAAVLLIIGVLAPGTAPAADMEILITQDALQKFFEAAAPFNYEYQTAPGMTVAALSMTDPKLILVQGNPGQVFVEFQVNGESKLLGLPPFTGQAKPEVVFGYSPVRNRLEISLKDFVLQVGENNIPIIGLLEPTHLPLIPNRPVQFKDHMVLMETTKVATEVTPAGLKLLTEYRFLRLENIVPEAPKLN